MKSENDALVCAYGLIEPLAYYVQSLLKIDKVCRTHGGSSPPLQLC